MSDEALGVDPVGGSFGSTRRVAISASLFAFVGSGCLLVLELVAARLIAPDLGVSLYTWTSVIGVVLGGVSLGNFLGGRIGDRWPSRQSLAWVYLAGSASTALVLVVSRSVEAFELPNSAPAMLQVLWVTAVLFFVPSTVLGIPTPILTRLSLRSVDGSARVVGRVQAAATLGSITGVFLTGFGLISWFGVRHVIAGVAVVLLIMSVCAALPRSLLAIGATAVVALSVGVAAVTTSSPCTRESDYYCIRVASAPVEEGTRPVDAPAPRELYLDHLLHSTFDPVDPNNLGYGYEQAYARVVQAMWPDARSLDSFFVGGGGFVFPRYMERNYGGRLTVAEIDPEVTAVAREQLGFTPSSRMRVVGADARRELASLAERERFDVVFGDAFNDYAVPYHLTTREFHELVAERLAPDGAYVMNLVDGENHGLLRSEVATLRETFSNVGVLIPATGWPPVADRDTFVIVAANRPLPAGLLLVSLDALDAFLANGRRVVLTDDYAPVDQMLAPVFDAAMRRPDF